jgi:tetratricopeptide (TPR) repeat protein
LQESGVGLATYLRFYEQQWSELMASDDLADAPLQDYPERSVWTTWAISYQAIRERHEHTANLLLLWSFLDNKDLWHGLFATACVASPVASRMLSGWIGNVASSEIEFSKAMQLLCNYSLVEQMQETGSYATHPVVHQWAHHSQGKRFATELSRLAVVAVGWAVPESSTRDYAVLQRRLLLHAQACSRQVVERNAVWDREAEDGSDRDVDEDQERKTVLDAVHMLGLLYAAQGRLGEAEKMCERALRGKEEALGVGHSSTLDTVNNLGILYKNQGKLGEAEQMYERALRGYEALGLDHESLDVFNNLGALYADQGRLGEAEKMCERALRGKEEALGVGHSSTLNTINNLGLLYADQGRLGEAEQMYERALRGKEEAFGVGHSSTLDTVNNLGLLYYSQGKLGEAEQMYERALRGYEELGGVRVQQYPPALTTLQNMGDLYATRAESAKARAVYTRALSGLTSVLGPSSERCMGLSAKIDALPSASRERQGQSKLATVGERPAPQHDRTKGSKLSVRRLIRKLC